MTVCALQDRIIIGVVFHPWVTGRVFRFMRPASTKERSVPSARTLKQQQLQQQNIRRRIRSGNCANHCRKPIAGISVVDANRSRYKENDFSL